MSDKKAPRFDQDGWVDQMRVLNEDGPDERGMYKLPGTVEDAMYAASFFNPDDDSFPYQTRLREMSYRVPWLGAWTPVHIVIAAQTDQVGYMTSQKPASATGPEWRLELEQVLESITCRPDDPHGADYRRIVDAMIEACPEGEPALETIWRLSGKHGLRTLIADALQERYQRQLKAGRTEPGDATLLMVAEQEAGRGKRPEKKR